MIAEELLHFVWQFRLFNHLEIYSTDDEQIKIFDVGQYNTNAGPDFLFSRVSIAGQDWYGHIEIHVDGADWYVHEHHLDSAYNNVVLHVVYKNPIAAMRKDGTTIPCLHIHQLVSMDMLARYHNVQQNRHWIPCEKHLPDVGDLQKMQVLDRMGIARLEYRAVQIEQLLIDYRGDWEQVLFLMLCRSFGMKVNAQPFMDLGRLINLSLFRRYSNNVSKQEAMVLGQAGFLSEAANHSYVAGLINEYKYLKKAHTLKEMNRLEWKFMRMRPYNFPTFRLAQLVALYGQTPYLFGKLLSCERLEDITDFLIDTSLPDFWQTHFLLEKSSSKHSTGLSKSFVEHLAINAFIPILFTYGKQMRKEAWQYRAWDWLSQLKPERNSVTAKFDELTLSATNAAESQGLLQLKQEYCEKKRCLQCHIGAAIFRS